MAQVLRRLVLGLWIFNTLRDLNLLKRGCVSFSRKVLQNCNKRSSMVYMLLLFTDTKDHDRGSSPGLFPGHPGMTSAFDYRATGNWFLRPSPVWLLQSVANISRYPSGNWQWGQDDISKRKICTISGSSIPTKSSSSGNTVEHGRIGTRPSNPNAVTVMFWGKSIVNTR